MKEKFVPDNFIVHKNSETGRLRLRHPILIMLFSAILIIAAFIYLGNNIIQVSYYTVKSGKIPKAFNGFKILQLSDLHNKSFGKGNHYLIKKINVQNPDIIVMTGDMVDTTDTDFKVFIDLAKQISKSYDTYYVVGNHEQSLSDDKFRMLTNELKSNGIKVVDNGRAAVKKGNDRINIYGLWFNLRYYKDVNNENTKGLYFSQAQIKSILDGPDDSLYNILLTHNPLYFDSYSSWGADLTLSGHIHGGMIRIPFVGGLFSPERDFFPKYNSGRYQLSGKDLIVNRGLGNGNSGIRLFNPPEITVITLSN